jgi:hypothetical protein
MNSKGAVAGSNSMESKVFDYDRREDGCGSSINPKGNCLKKADSKQSATFFPAPLQSPFLSHDTTQ